MLVVAILYKLDSYTNITPFVRLGVIFAFAPTLIVGTIPLILTQFVAQIWVYQTLLADWGRPLPVDILFVPLTVNRCTLLSPINPVAVKVPFFPLKPAKIVVICIVPLNALAIWMQWYPICYKLFGKVLAQLDSALNHF